MVRYGIIGGTFDPIHYAHLYIAYEAKEQLSLDEVIFMPAGKQPLKASKKVTDSDLRYEMVEMAIEPFEEFSISTYEIEKEGLSFTYETLEYLKNNLGKKKNVKRSITEYEKLELAYLKLLNKTTDEKNTYESILKEEHIEDDKESELFFITGSDCLMNIEKWREVSKIFSLCTLVVFVRGGFDKTDLLEKKKKMEEKYDGKIIILDLKELEISSTDIRDRISKNKRIDFFVPPNVVKFIYETGLYMDK